MENPDSAALRAYLTKVVHLTNAAKEHKNEDGTVNERRTKFLKSLSGIYSSLPHYVHPVDPALCSFPESFKYDEFLFSLGEAIAGYLSDWTEVEIYVIGEDEYSATFMTGAGLKSLPFQYLYPCCNYPCNFLPVIDIAYEFNARFKNRRAYAVQMSKQRRSGVPRQKSKIKRVGGMKLVAEMDCDDEDNTSQRYVISVLSTYHVL